MSDLENAEIVGYLCDQPVYEAWDPKGGRNELGAHRLWVTIGGRYYYAEAQYPETAFEDLKKRTDLLCINSNNEANDG